MPKTILAVVLLCTIVMACAPVPSEAPRPAPSSACLSACNTLLRLGCAEGADNCPWIMQRMNDWAATPDKATGKVLTCVSVFYWKNLDDLTRHSNWTCTQLNGRRLQSWMAEPMIDAPPNEPVAPVVP